MNKRYMVANNRKIRITLKNIYRLKEYAFMSGKKVLFRIFQKDL